LLIFEDYHEEQNVIESYNLKIFLIFCNNLSKWNDPIEFLSRHLTFGLAYRYTSSLQHSVATRHGKFMNSSSSHFGYHLQITFKIHIVQHL